MKRIVPLASLALLACSPSADRDADKAAGSPPPSATPVTIADGADPNVLRLEGLPSLRIGQPVPAGSSFTVRGTQIPGSDCRTLGSPDYPGVHVIASGDEVRRISVSEASAVRLVEGIGPGAAEAEVRAAFPGLLTEPHKYVAAPAKYLSQPGANPRLRFEIGADGKVGRIHVGLSPELGYVEGCA